MPERIHVLQVTKSTGAVGQYIRWLVNGLDKKRFQVTVVCLSEGSEKLSAELSQLDGVRAVNLQMDRYRISPLSDARVWWQLRSLIKQGCFDVIHAHTSKPGFLVRTAAVGTGIPTIYRPAGFAFHDRVAKWKALIYASVERVVAYFFTDRIVTVCNEERDFALRYHVGSKTQLVTVYTGISLSRFAGEIDRCRVRRSLNVPEDVFLVGTVGRLSKQKAPADFIRAAFLVSQTQPQAHFVWVGDGELEAEARSLIHSLGLENVFHLVGHRDDIPNILKVMDCFVLASHWEGFSLSVLEAMAAGLPVVISKVSGAAEAVVDDETGYLFPIGDVQALAEIIERFISEPQKGLAFGLSGRQRVEQKFTLTRMVKEIEEIYENLVFTGSSN